MNTKISEDLATAMKQGNKQTVNALKQLKAALITFSIAQGKEKPVTDDQVINVIRKLIAQGRDSISQFEKGNRFDLIEQERVRISVLETYLPTEMPEDQILEIIDKAINEVQATSMKDMGRVMNIVKQQTEGRVEGAKLSALIKAKLNG